MEIITAIELPKILITLLAVLIVGIILYYLLRSLSRHAIHGLQSVGNHLINSFFHGLANLETQDQDHPRSLPSIESMILPQVLRDFPDFDLAMTKNQVKDYLEEKYRGRKEFLVHNIVLTEYRTRTVKKCLVFQAAVCWRDQRLLQKKLEISMEFQCVKDKKNPAIICPNCGATLGFQDLECKYCGTRINDRRDQEWSFASIREIY